MGICNLLSTFLHNTFYVGDARMARHEQRHGRYECPPSILDNSAGKHFQYTCVFLEESWLGISYISSNEKNLPLDQSYKSHSSHSDTASCLCQTGGKYCSNILQTVCCSPHKSAGHAGVFHSWCTALPLLWNGPADDLRGCRDIAGMYRACHNKVPNTQGAKGIQEEDKLIQRKGRPSSFSGSRSQITTRRYVAGIHFLAHLTLIIFPFNICLNNSKYNFQTQQTNKNQHRNLILSLNRR